MFDFLKSIDSVSRSVFIFISDLMIDMMRNEIEMERKLREKSLIMSEYGLLTIVANQPNLTINSLAEMVNVTSSTIVIRLNNLEEKQLIERERSEKDRRKVFVNVTEKGKNIISEIGEFHPEELILSKIAILTKAEKLQFESIISKINQSSDVTDDEHEKLFRFMLNKRLFETTHGWE